MQQKDMPNYCPEAVAVKIRTTQHSSFDPITVSARQGKRNADATSFAGALKNQENRMTEEHITRLLREIEVQGQRLSKSMTVRDLHLYKNLVKRFMEEAVKYGVALDERRGSGRRGRGRIYKIIKEVDKKLLDLTDAILQQEKSGLDILNRIGEIRGMLINLYL